MCLRGEEEPFCQLPRSVVQLEALEWCVHTQCPAHIHQVSITQLPTHGRDSQSEAGGFRTSHTCPLNLHLPPMQELPVSTAVLKTNSSQEALSKDLSKHCQYFDARLDSSWETFWPLTFPQVSPVQTLETQGCAKWALAGKWERKVFKCRSHLTQHFGVSTGKGSTTASSDFPWLVPAQEQVWRAAARAEPPESTSTISYLCFHISNEQRSLIWTLLISCLHPQSKGTRRMREKLTCLSKFHQHSSQKCSLPVSVRNENISIFMPVLGNFDFILQNFSLGYLPICMM